MLSSYMPHLLGLDFYSENLESLLAASDPRGLYGVKIEISEYGSGAQRRGASIDLHSSISDLAVPSQLSVGRDSKN